MPNPRTPHEGEAIQMLAKGLKHREIADQLGIGVATVARIAKRIGIARKPQKLAVAREGINYAAEAANLRWGNSFYQETR